MIREAYHMLPAIHWLVRVQEVGEDMPSNMYFFFFNFKSLELYWTYLLALQTMTPKFFLKRLMSLDHKLKMRWCILGFVVILCKYGLLLEKPLSMNMREVIWAVRFDSLLGPNPYVDVDDVMGYDPNWWRWNVDR